MMKFKLAKMKYSQSTDHNRGKIVMSAMPLLLKLSHSNQNRFVTQNPFQPLETYLNFSKSESF